MKGNSSNFIAFDIGSSKIAAIASNITKQGRIKVNSQILHHAEGFKSGMITHMELAENTIVTAIYALEKECDKSIKEVAISLSGTGVKSYYINHKIKLGNQTISKQDIKKLINKALSDFKVKDQEIIHYFPMEFVIDEGQIVDNPVGMYARSVSCHLHIISADSLMLMNLSKCLDKCHVRINDVTVAIYASALACLSADEKELGSIIVDIGSHTTSFGVFLNGQIVYVGHVPIGSMHITTDIAKQFSISLHEADKLKILYGNANPDLISKDTTIRLDDISSSENYHADLSITTIELSKMIHSRIEEIFLNIKDQYNHISMDNLISRRMVITGGASSMPGIKNLAAEIFQKQIRIAKPENLPGFAEDNNPYAYSTVVGMLKAESSKYQKDSIRSYQDDSGGIFKRMFSWLKENV
ncbi:MAG: cell division protein FtsA [Rickettsiales bacterium]|nr:MAG: cell division protein FtsA [Rickettsiales bacterium]